MRNGLGKLAARNVDQLAAIVKNRLKKIQYRPALIDGFLAQTELILEPQPPVDARPPGLSESVAEGRCPACCSGADTLWC